MSARVQCEKRDQLLGKTCRQYWRSYLEHWCMTCCIRFDHDCGKHNEDPESDCPECQRLARSKAK